MDIPIYDYIKDNYKKYRLFLRHNHPCNKLMNIYGYRIYLKMINILGKSDVTKYNESFDTSSEILNHKDTYEVINEATHKVLELEWQE